VTRILAIDYGTKRIGLAVTDPLQIIATGLDTVPTNDIFEYLKKYLFAESVSKFVVGFPMHLDGSPAQLAPTIEKLRLLMKMSVLPQRMPNELFCKVEQKRKNGETKV
jgi:putative Holliday junction resolvase